MGERNTPSEDARMSLSIMGGDRGWKIFLQSVQLVDMTYVTAIKSLQDPCLFRALISCTYNYLEDFVGCLNTPNYVQNGPITGGESRVEISNANGPGFRCDSTGLQHRGMNYWRASRHSPQTYSRFDLGNS
jgi:hypothetical protein